MTGLQSTSWFKQKAIPQLGLRREQVALVALFAGIAVFHASALMRTPAPFVDEGWNTARAWGLIRTGIPFGTPDAGVVDQFEGYWTFFPWLPTLLQAWAIQLLGLSLFSVRLLSLGFGLLLLLSIYAIGHRLYGHHLAILAVLLTSTSNAFFLSSHLARHDVMVTAMGFSAVALYLHDRGTSLSPKSVASGLAIGLAFEMHPNAAIYGLPILALYAHDYRFRALRTGRFWGFVVGAFAGLLFYIGIHILPYPQTFASLTQVFYGPTRVPPILTLDPALWWQSLIDTLSLLFAAVDLRIAILFPAATVVLLRPSSRSDKRVLLLFAALLVATILFIRAKYFYYGILISPAGDLLLAVFLSRLLNTKWNASPWTYLRTAVVLALIVAPAIRFILPPAKDHMSDYNTVLVQLADIIPASSSVMGPQTYWFALPNHRYISWEQLAFYQRYAPGSTLEDALSYLRPDFIVIDSRMRNEFIVDDVRKAYRYDWLQLAFPKTELESFLNRQARLDALSDTTTFGNVSVYRIDWSSRKD